MRTKRLVSLFFLALIWVQCGLLPEKKETDTNLLNALFLGAYLQNLSASCDGPQSGFTICIPRGIAE